MMQALDRHFASFSEVKRQKTVPTKLRFLPIMIWLHASEEQT